MKKFEFSFNIYGIAIVVFLFALLRLSHAIIVLTHPKTAAKAAEKVKAMGTGNEQTFASQTQLPELIK